jgi:hypothetical protein
MGVIKEPEKALALIGLIYGRDFNIENIIPEFTDRLGGILSRSNAMPFTQTDYYEKEMGKNLIRQWLFFDRLIAPDGLADLKVWSSGIEGRHSREKGDRQVNIDPGMITLNNLILASTKNYAHRIYLGQGIYAETTLIYRHSRFQHVDWTYPDYKTDAALAFFAEAREYLKKILHKP